MIDVLVTGAAIGGVAIVFSILLIASWLARNDPAPRRDVDDLDVWYNPRRPK